MNQEELQEQFPRDYQYQIPEQPKRPKSGFGKGFIIGVIVTAAAALILSNVNVHFGSENVLDQATRRKINLLSRFISESYYEDVDAKDLREGLYAGLFENLDVYSQYYTAEEYQEMYESSVSGTYCGIGASLQQDVKTNIVTVIRVYDGSPAQEGGLMEGDILLAADEYEANSMELTEFVSHVRGEEGSYVHLTVYRESTGDELEFDIERRNLVVPTVTYEMMEDGIGYIQVTEFTESTTQQFTDALQDLKNQGMQSLIIDIRSNPGGLLNVVCEMVDEILPQGLIVYTEDKAGERIEYTSTDEKSMDIPLVVLVDENSASASEIFAGAIQDREAGIIVGTTTYGKGVVQTIRTLGDGSAFKLTTNRYFTPGGTCIQDIGIKPDIEIEYEFLGSEEDTYSYEFDNQLQKAIELLEGE